MGRCPFTKATAIRLSCSYKLQPLRPFLFFSFTFFFFFKVSELLKSLWRVTTYCGQFMKQQTISLLIHMAAGNHPLVNYSRRVSALSDFSKRIRFVPGFFIKSYLNIYIYIYIYILNRLYMDYHSLNSTLAHILPYLILSVAWHVGRCGRCLKKLTMRISSHSFLYTNLTISNLIH